MSNSPSAGTSLVLGGRETLYVERALRPPLTMLLNIIDTSSGPGPRQYRPCRRSAAPRTSRGRAAPCSSSGRTWSLPFGTCTNSSRKAFDARERPPYTRVHGSERLLAARTMARIGVMPIPPAMKMYRSARTSSRLFRGPLAVMTSSSRTRACIHSDPPRLAGSRSTAIRCRYVASTNR